MTKKVTLIALYDESALGVRSIYSVLKSEGVDTSLIFFKRLINNNNQLPTREEKTKLIKLLKEIGPDIIGVSLRSTFFRVAVDITREIRKELDSLIVWGGT